MHMHMKRRLATNGALLSMSFVIKVYKLIQREIRSQEDLTILQGPEGSLL